MENIRLVFERPRFDNMLICTHILCKADGELVKCGLYIRRELNPVTET